MRFFKKWHKCIDTRREEREGGAGHLVQLGTMLLKMIMIYSCACMAVASAVQLEACQVI